MASEKKAVLYLSVEPEVYWAAREAAARERMSVKDLVLARLAPDLKRSRELRTSDQRLAAK